MDHRHMKMAIRTKYVFLISVLYLLSGTIVWGGSREARQDIWLVMLVNVVLFSAIMMLYAKLCTRYPGKNLFELFGMLLPKPVMIGLSIGYCAYALLIGAISWWNFSQFTSLHVLRETPRYAVVFLLAFVCVWCVKRGARTLGHFASFVFPFVCAILAITLGLSIKRMDLMELLPVYYDPASFWSGAFTMTAYPFGDIVLLFAAYGAVEQYDKGTKAMTGAVVCAFGILLLIMVRNVALLGVPILSEVNYATYHAMGVIGLEDFFKRIEVLLTFAVAFCDVVKGSIALLFACQGLSAIFALRDDTVMAIPAAFLIAGVGLLIFDTSAEMDVFLYAFRYVSLPLQLLGPGLLLTVSCLRRRNEKKRNG